MFGLIEAQQDLQAQLAEVKNILRRAQRTRALQDAEPGWNEQVHSRVLELALKGQTKIGFQNMYVSSPSFLSLRLYHARVKS